MRVDPRAQMLPRGMQPASLMRVSQPTSVGVMWFGPWARLKFVESSQQVFWVSGPFDVVIGPSAMCYGLSPIYY